jgi:hypothetical protein
VFLTGRPFGQGHEEQEKRATAAAEVENALDRHCAKNGCGGFVDLNIGRPRLRRVAPVSA